MGSQNLSGSWGRILVGSKFGIIFINIKRCINVRVVINS